MRWIALVTCLGLCAASTAGGRAQGSTCPPTLANRLSSTRSATQLVTVATASSGATHGLLTTWRRSGGCWRVVAGPWWAWVGQKGISEHKREGDRTTPAGAYGFGPVMYGVAPNPGVRYRYHDVVCGDWWVEDPSSRWYNRFRHVRCGAQPPFKTTSEDLSRSPTAYHHFAVIAYNAAPVVPGRGSGIFLHASTGTPTLGCISLQLPRLVRVLRWLRPSAHPLIVIGTTATIRRY
jgi:L,D-peptidoglycan transpeptidase YkuD (ErfK/YbiS/YcfS/YnhG family)